ncbi:ABC transporter permease [Paenibacillus sp. FSL P4-0081]|uniref:ABC transporter permease n=1 Tax=Paenibacillus sp. FSL P4-0081 TaxID=1536769 RepID=UPI000B04ACBB|nr:ABC transporter permease subunit [Paenibacillus sp. FSL P4-0081]
MRDSSAYQLTSTNGGLNQQRHLWTEMKKHKYLYLLVAPMIIYFIVFSYIPMYGILLAFKEFDYSKGILGSPWNHFENFRIVLSDQNFHQAFRNTILIGLGRLLIEFPVPIIVAILLSELPFKRLKKFYQTALTFPHFISWIVLSGILIGLLGDQGVINQLLSLLGFEKNTILSNSGLFTALIFISNIWKEAGWSAIIYLAAIAGVNMELYEAVTVDGANRFQKVKAVTWPAVKAAALILLVLAVGNLLNGGFDQIFNLYNPIVADYSEILDTYVYKTAFIDATGFGYSTTVGLLKSVISFVFLFSTNAIVNKMSDGGGL